MRRHCRGSSQDKCLLLIIETCSWLRPSRRISLSAETDMQSAVHKEVLAHEYRIHKRASELRAEAPVAGPTGGPILDADNRNKAPSEKAESSPQDQSNTMSLLMGSLTSEFSSSCTSAGSGE